MKMKASLSFPSQIRKLGVALLNQQLWLFGCDVRRKEGNLLVDYGFDRTRPPEGVRGASQYAKPQPNGELMILWGFGLYLESACGQGLFLKRHQFSPRLMSRPEHVWSAKALPQKRPPKCVEDCLILKNLMCKACQLLAEYETWVLQTAGMKYRQGNLDKWGLKTICQPHETADRWKQLAQSCAELTIKQKS